MGSSILDLSPEDIAVIGIGCRFPGASNPDTFWKNIESGKESIRFFTDDELINAGISENDVRNDHYVKAMPIIEDSDKFDYSFFGISKREAQFIDPQHRVLLECAWETLENAGYGNKETRPLTSIFAGCSICEYSKNVWNVNHRLIDNSSPLLRLISEDKDFLATRIAYLLNLTGPSMTIQTGCSTSLVAVKLAVMHLQNFECDMALAGGVTLRVPSISGYYYREGEIFSPDGHCRPFDSESNGTIFGEGSGLILLKRIEDAIENNDTIYAVIKSIATNNDGNRKVGYTAPSVQGQIDVITTALALANISPETISMIEAHGTATKLGDPIEVAALSNVYGRESDKKNFCALGSVKSNIGHLDTAAGIAGLIKTILSLKNKKIPANLHIKRPNSELMINQSPFYIPDKTVDWLQMVDKNGQVIPRRAGVSSFGVGGTNAHAILQEFPEENSLLPDNKYYTILLSAKSSNALDKLRKNLSNYIDSNPCADIGNMAFTLFSGREHFEYRWSAGCHTALELKEKLLRKQDNYDTYSTENQEQPIVFMFSGQGNQYINMGNTIYQQDQSFRENLNLIADILFEFNGTDIKPFFVGDHTIKSDLHELINQTEYTQPCLFAFEYCVALLLIEWGIKPSLLIGHSIGELVAATIAGVFKPEDAIKLVATRAEIMQRQPKGAMIAVAAPESEISKILPLNNIDPVIALINSPSSCVLSGSDEAITSVKSHLVKNNIAHTALRTSHAFHSPMMNAAANEFKLKVGQFDLSKPKIPIISNVYGRILKDSEAISSQYWSDHICKPVRFSDGIIFSLNNNRIFLEVGPGNSLCSMVKNHYRGNNNITVLQTIPTQRLADDSPGLLYDTIGKLWNIGVTANFTNFFKTKHKRIALPTYPFERTRCWLEEIDTELITKDTVSITNNGLNLNSSFDINIEKIIEIWKNYLGTDIINANDDFFALGGHSLLASQIINTISSTLNINLPPSSIFISSTPEKLMQRIQESINTRKTAAKPIAEKPFTKKTEAPLSPVQKRLWFITQLEPNSPAYNLMNTAIINGIIKKNLFIAAISKITKRHDSLRATFHSKDGEPFATIHQDFTPIVTFDSFFNQSYEEAQIEITNRLKDEAKKIFNMSEGPLWYVKVFETADDKSIMAMLTHHIISDGWSFNLFINELCDFYHELAKDIDFEPPQLSHFYSDYAESENTRIKESNFINHEKYWKSVFSSALPILTLPIAKNRPLKNEYNGSISPISFPFQFRNALQAIVKNSGATLFTGMITLFSLLLYKYGGEDKIIIGTPYSGRDRSEWENIIGFFINMLPINFEINPNTTFNEYLSESSLRIKETLSHNQYPFSSLVELIKPPREININPVFQVMCVYQTVQPPDLKNGSNISFQPFYMDRGISEYDMTLYIWDNGEDLSGVLEYNTSLFDKTVIEKMLAHFEQLMKNAITFPDLKINSISIMTTDEYDSIVRSCSNANSINSLNPGLIQLIKQKVIERPEAVSCIFGKKQLNYDQLWNLSERIAFQLKKNGAENGKLIGLCVERSVEMVATLLAIIKTGAAYLPLDPAFPSIRLRQIIKESKTELIITDFQSKRLFKGNCKVKLIDINSLANYNSDNSIQSDISWPNNTDTAYVLFTSGSTGKPKGVEIMHGSLLNFLLSMQKNPGMKEEDILLAVTTLSFDISGLEIWLPLICGATIRIISREKVSDGFELLNEINKGRVTMMQATPSTWKILLDAGWKEGHGFKALCGGEAFSRDLANRILQTGSRLWNMYGPTETTIWSSISEVLPNDEPISLGEPIDNTWLIILDDKGLPIPSNIPGELCIGGFGLAKGYLNEPELTLTKFTEPPKGFEFLGRIYHTGDLVIKHPNGNLIFLGRIDHQVKLRGYRIELPEIENQICKIPGIMDCVVWTPEDPNGVKRLVAYVILEENLNKNEISSIVKKGLKNFLPSYMIPEYVEIMNNFPLTSNRKIDRKALNFPANSKKESDRKFLIPENEKEKALLEIWKKVLCISNISTDDDYFERGGNSFLATRLFAEIDKKFNIRLPLALLYEAPTIQLQAKYIDQNSVSKHWNVIVPLRTSGSKPPLFLVHGAGGNILLYRDLVNFLGNDQPVYGIQSKGLDGKSKPLRSIEEMGQEYAKEIISVFPEGPYLVGGYCMGGLIAYEIARILLSSDKVIGMVALLDTAAYWTNMNKIQKWIFVYENATFHFKNFIKADNAGKYTFLRDRTYEAFRRIRIKVNTIANHITARPNKSNFAILDDINTINDNAARIFKPKPYDGKVTLFRPFTNFSLIESNTMGWDKIKTGGLDIISLSAYPKGILVNPYVKELADRIKGYIDMRLTSLEKERYIKEADRFASVSV